MQHRSSGQHSRSWALPLLLSLALLSVATLFATSVSAADEQQEQPALLELNTDIFADTIERQAAPALVMFVVRDKCEACKQLAPVVAKVAANLKGIATVGTVDCNTIPAVRTCRAYAAHAFPKILVFKPGTKVNPYTGGSMKDFDEFKGPASAKGLITAVTDTLDTSHLTQLNTTAQHEDFLQQQAPASLKRVLLFTDKAASTVLARGLSWAYERRLLFGEVRPSVGEGKAIAERYGVDKYPTIVIVKPDDGSSEIYTGSLKAPELRTFLDGFASKEPVAPDAASSSTGTDSKQGGVGAGGGPQDIFSGVQVVVHSLDSSNLTEIDQQDDMWLLAFHASSEADSCASQLEQLHKLLVEVQGIVNYGSFNTTGVDAEVLAPYKLDTAALSASPCSPQLVLLPYGDFKQSKGAAYSRWTGGLDDAKALQEWILQSVPDFTSRVSDEVEAQHFLDATASELPKAPKARTAEERNAPIGKVLLFSTKSEAPAIYKALAMQFAGKSRLLFAWSQASSEGPSHMLMQRMNVRKAPAMTILFPLPPKPLGTDNEEVPNNPRDNMALQQYMGPLKFQKMLAWLTAMSTLTGMSYKAHAGATTGPAPEDFEVRSQEHLESACYDKPGLCLLTLLDGRSDTANKVKDTVKKSAAAHAGQPVNWVVLDVAAQPSFRRAYGFTADQLPALVALSTKRMRFAQGAAPYGEDTTKQLVTKVLMGTAITLPLPDLPRLVPGGEAEEASEEAVEEEFRLDEIMAEEVKELYRKEDRIKQADDELQQQEADKAKKKKKKSSKKKKKAAKKAKQKDAGSVKDEL